MRASLLLVWFIGAAPAHPGADSHMHATTEDACDPDIRARRLGALLAEERIKAAYDEIDRQRSCELYSPGAAVAEGRLAMMQRNDETAVTLLTAVIEREPTHSGALQLRATFWHRLNAFDKATDDLLVIARSHPAAHNAWLQAWKEAASGDDHERAIAILEEGMAAVGPTERLTVMAAHEHLLHGDPKRAIELLADQPDTVGNLEKRAIALAKLDDPAARAAYEAALDKARGMRTSPAKQAIVDRLRKNMKELGT